MLNLLTSQQIRQADQHTISTAPIDPIDLMENAAQAFTDIFVTEFPDQEIRISIYCGSGNNGGDGLAIARLLNEKGYRFISVKIVKLSSPVSSGFSINRKRLAKSAVEITEIKDKNFPDEKADLIIDALLGNGLNKPLDGKIKALVEHLNQLNKKVVAVDVPTGFCCEGYIDPAATVLSSDLVITFQRPKLNFFFPESANAINHFKVADIGLDEEFIEAQRGSIQLLTHDDIKKILKPRKPFSNKGTYGHALILAGSPQTMGAALLCAEACMHTGAGLTTACIPPEGLAGLNARIPEIMAIIRDKNFTFSDLDKFTAIAVGPGLGYSEQTVKLVKDMVLKSKRPIVVDADGLNMMTQRVEWIAKLPENSILTPHMKEFDRLFGAHDSWWDRVETAKKHASENKLIIVLKSRYTFIITPSKQVLINSTGGPSMASGGMGDVLTGIIVSFLAQGYNPQEAAILGTYIHGYCGQNYQGYVCPPSGLVRELSRTIGSFIDPEK